ncbi:DNA methylase N-4/N-6 domain protein, partial [mine drainage metagenome]
MEDESIDLIVTSPPYPMIEMWDHLFSELNAEIREALTVGDGLKAFELMHRELDKTWKECYRALKKGGIICINIGDTTRSIGNNFSMFPSQSRIISNLTQIGTSLLPSILWRKTTNSPNKFLGSGTLPVGAYVTLEHEHIIIFRKGERRKFTGNEKNIRRESSFFWEERNQWFSDIWQGIQGIKQKSFIYGSRNRKGAYPMEIPLRLISMFSLKGDTVLDPFLGTGTTVKSSIILERNSIGLEIDGGFVETARKSLLSEAKTLNH